MDATGNRRTGNRMVIRRAGADDLAEVTDLDALVTGQAKPDYWQDIFERYGTRRTHERFFLVAEAPARPGIAGMIVGEVRGWEFGSEPCGWIFVVTVDPNCRERHVGEQLFKAICDAFRRIGISKVRTMVRRQEPLHMSFFRGEGMMAGPYTQLELTLDDS